VRIRKVEATRKVALLVVLTLALLGVQGAFDTAAAQVSGDHYKVYDVDPVPIAPHWVLLEDQFGIEEMWVDTWEMFGVPVDKNGEGILDPLTHGTVYPIDSPGHPVRWLQVTNQFGTQTLKVQDPRYLVNWAQRLPLDPPLEQNHFKCYEVVDPPSHFVPAVLLENDSWGPPELVDVWQAVYFCNPVSKNGSGILHPDSHLTCYDITPKFPLGIFVDRVDQFGFQFSIVRENQFLCAPSSKIVLPTPPPPIPALSTWGLVAFLLLMATGGMLILRRRSRAPSVQARGA
jgi:hypothetical protein